MEFRVYLESDRTIEEEGIDFIAWWRKMKINSPQLSGLAIRNLNAPVASVDVERSFSIYRDILSHKRCNLTSRSLNTLSMINFHHNLKSNDE